MLNVVVGLWDHLYSWGDKEWWIKSNTELTNQVNVTAFEVFKEICGSWLGYSTKVVDQLVFSHSDTIVDNFKHMLVLIELYLDFEFSLASKYFWVFDGQEAYFIKCIWGVTDDLSKEDFFLGVKGVDDDIHQSRMSGNVPADFSDELELFFLSEDSEAREDDHKGHQ